MGLSQHQLAARSGVSRPTIHRVENHQQVPHRSTAYKLADALDVEPHLILPRLHDEWLFEPSIGVQVTKGIRDRAMPGIRAEARKKALNPADVDDLVGAGLEGLYEACRKYDSDHGTPLHAFVMLYARWRLRDEARRLYKQHPGFGLEPQGIEPWHYG